MPLKVPELLEGIPHLAPFEDLAVSVPGESPVKCITSEQQENSCGKCLPPRRQKMCCLHLAGVYIFMRHKLCGDHRPFDERLIDGVTTPSNHIAGAGFVWPGQSRFCDSGGRSVLLGPAGALLELGSRNSCLVSRRQFHLVMCMCMGRNDCLHGCVYFSLKIESRLPV